MQHPVLSSDLDSAGSIYPLRVPYEALEAVGRVVDDLENFDFERGLSIFISPPPIPP